MCANCIHCTRNLECLVPSNVPSVCLMNLDLLGKGLRKRPLGLFAWDNATNTCWGCPHPRCDKPLYNASRYSQRAPTGKCHRLQDMTFFLDQAQKQNNVKITEGNEVLGLLQHLSLFSADHHRTRWSTGIKEFEATVRKENCLTTICRTDKIK